MKKYLITSPELYTSTPSDFRKNLILAIKRESPEYLLFRDKENPNYENLAIDFLEVCKQFKGAKSFLHQNIGLASKLNADGVHLTSTQFDEIKKAKGNNLEVIISTHTHEEVLKAQELGADAVTYSPIFISPNKGLPKGIDDLKELLKKSTIKVFALGGIVSRDEIKLLESSNVYGFASIRYFNKK